MHNGKRYSHTIHPQTGLPVDYLKSVSVISPSAELSDALATAVTCMGVEKGLEFIDQLPHTYAVFVNQDNELFLSRGIQYEKDAI